MSQKIIKGIAQMYAILSKKSRSILTLQHLLKIKSFVSDDIIKICEVNVRVILLYVKVTSNFLRK